MNKKLNNAMADRLLKLAEPNLSDLPGAFEALQQELRFGQRFASSLNGLRMRAEISGLPAHCYDDELSRLVADWKQGYAPQEDESPALAMVSATDAASDARQALASTSIFNLPGVKHFIKL